MGALPSVKLSGVKILMVSVAVVASSVCRGVARQQQHPQLMAASVTTSTTTITLQGPF